uniref:Uncharacterized protein n=1 Tax=Arundo donax TaxID=35708 RepID=A0A0A8YG93_ARUDO
MASHTMIAEFVAKFGSSTFSCALIFTMYKFECQTYNFVTLEALCLVFSFWMEDKQVCRRAIN